MTNEALLDKGRSLEINNTAEWLVEDRILLACYPSYNDAAVPDKYALLFHDDIRVGIVYFMGSYDIHWLVFPEHRGKGYMSHFVTSGVIEIVEPELRMVLLDRYSEDYHASKHLVKLAGLRYCHSQTERETFARQLYEERSVRLNAPCRCGSGEKYKSCCRYKDDLDAENEMQPCWDCDVYKSHTTATRCWKCGGDYED